MLDKFWESIGENLAGEWLKHVFSPAFLFWAGGFGFFVAQQGWQKVWNELIGKRMIEQAGMLVSALIVLIMSSLLMKNLRFPILRLLEGYWPRPLEKLEIFFSNILNQRFENQEQKWNELKKNESMLMRVQHRHLSDLEMKTRYFPVLLKDVQPTVLGNIIRAAETTPFNKYGLDAVACWPSLWLLIPNEARENMRANRESLMNKVELWAWGLLFLIWGFWSLWAVAIAIIWLILSVNWLHQSAIVYGNLLEAIFDLYRWKIYENVRWPVPEKSGNAELEVGKRLSEFLWRGTTEHPVEYFSYDNQ